MKKVFLWVFLFVSNSIIHAQGLNHQWVADFESPTPPVYQNTVKADENGNVYMMGTFTGNIDFDPGPGTTTLSNPFLQNDIFLTKLDASGNFQWAIKLGGSDYDNGNQLCIDSDGNILVTGYFSGTADFDPGPGTFNMSSTGYADIFIWKLSPAGNLIWAKKIGGGDYDIGYGICTDPSDNVYVTGLFLSGFDFDPGAGVFPMSTSGNEDMFVLKLDEAGDFQWAKKIGGSAYQRGSAISIDHSGNVIATGWHSGTTDFDPDGGIQNLASNGDADAFVVKLNSTGNYIWARSFGGNSGSDDISYGITVDGDNNIAVCGRYYGSITTPVSTLNSVGLGDIFIVQFDALGNYNWAHSFGSPAENTTLAIDCDTSNHIYFCGDFNTSMDVDPGAGSQLISSVGQTDIFVLKLDQGGNYSKVWSMGSSSADRGVLIDVDSSMNIYHSGGFRQTIDFDLSTDTDEVTAIGEEIYIHKFKECFNSSSNFTIDACDSLVWMSVTLTTSGTYIDTIQNVTGCDSIITLNLTIHSTNSSLTNVTACEAYTWNSGLYTNTGIYTDTLMNINGCDSIATLDLVILHGTSSSNSVTSCDLFVWNSNTYTLSGIYTDTLTGFNGCDSIALLNLTIHNSTSSLTTITECNEFIWNAITYSASGIYTDTIANHAGCDSILTLDLTINTVDIAITNNDPVLNAAATGASYQWVDCDNNFAQLVNATQQQFEPVNNGNYAVIVQQNGCTDTSGCEIIQTLDIDAWEMNSIIRVFPNPAHDFIMIEMSEPGPWEIISVTGKSIFKGRSDAFNTQIDISGLESGLYFIQYKGRVLRFIKS